MRTHVADRVAGVSGSRRGFWRSPLGAIVLLIPAMVGGLPTTVHAGTIRHDRDDSLYRALAAQYPATGMVSGPGYMGSATLIAPDWVLTAKHCLPDPGQALSFHLAGHVYSADTSSYHGHPSLDVGVFQLTQVVTNVDCAELFAPSFGSPLGRVGTSVGYGSTGTGLTGEIYPAGTKRAVQNMIDQFTGGSNKLLVSDFDHPDDPGESSIGSSVPLDLEGNIAHGDSGGGLYVDVEGESYVIGVTSFMWWFDEEGDCDYGDGSGWVSVPQTYDWITSIAPANHIPEAYPDTYAVDEDNVLNVYPYEGVLDNDTDPDEDPLTAIQVSVPWHGTLLLNENGSFTYTPEDNYYGTDTFWYRAFDGVYSSDSVSVTLDVASINDVPVAEEDFYSVDEDDTLHVFAYDGVLDNDADVETASLELDAVLRSDALHGMLSLNHNGSFTYTPESGFSGLDTFEYQAYDGEAYSDLTTVTVEVLALLQIPGDANRDGVVNEEDASILSDNWGKAGATWAMGDFDGDQFVGPGDAVILAANWGYGENSEGGVATPEPSCVALLLSMAVGGFCFPLRRSR